MAVFQTNGCNGSDAEFICCDGSDAYREDDTVFERYILVDWDHWEMVGRMVGHKHTRGSR